ncbi:MAG: class I SAM-dependent methyltransferase [Anaerolineae bacterium]|nr:class I SAM-dependent methyltransferase [Anaerolineae bacterium]
MYSKSARYYDVIYSEKDYAGEAAVLAQWIEQYLRSDQRRLLDVACGTGRHIEYLKRNFEVEGIDISPELLEIAAQRNPEIPFHCGDMISFELDKKFDVVTCLFSAIGYVKTLDRLNQAVRSMTKHLVPGGLLIIEPWFTPDTWIPNTVHSLFVDEEDFKLARINTSLVEGRVSILDLHHLVGTPQQTNYFVEHHELGLFESEEMLDVYRRNGFYVFYDSEGLTGRGVYIGRLPLGKETSNDNPAP